MYRDKHVAIKKWTKRVNVGDGRGTEITAIADLHDVGQGPYFSLTYQETDKWTRRNHDIRAGGCNHELIVREWPQLEKYVGWHLFSWDRGPMHYTANAHYHYAQQNWERLARGVYYGALPTDEDVVLTDYSWEALEAWLDWRLPQLIELFRADMRGLFGEQLL